MIRVVVFIVSAAAVAALLMAALVGLPRFGGYRGPYGDIVNGTVKERCNTPQAVSAVTFDYRGFDTLGEEFLLFTAVAGALLLIRREDKERETEPRDQATGRKVPPIDDSLRAAGMLMFPMTFILGIAMILHGHLTPGGGFQGGVVVASAFYFIYLSGGYEDLEGFTRDHILDFAEAFGALAFAFLASFPLLRHIPFMTNFIIPGKFGEINSGGTLPFYNTATGVEVAAGFLLLIFGFLRQAVVIRRGGGK